MEYIIIILAVIVTILAALCGFLGFWVRELLHEKVSRDMVDKLKALEKKMVVRTMSYTIDDDKPVNVDMGTVYDNTRVRTGMNTETTVKLPVLKEPLTAEQIKAQDDFYKQMRAEDDFPASESLNEDMTKKLPDE